MDEWMGEREGMGSGWVRREGWGASVKGKEWMSGWVRGKGWGVDG